MGLVDGLLNAALGGNSNNNSIQGALLNAVLKQVWAATTTKVAQVAWLICSAAYSAAAVSNSKVVA